MNVLGEGYVHVSSGATEINSIKYPSSESHRWLQSTQCAYWKLNLGALPEQLLITESSLLFLLTQVFNQL